MIITGVVKWFSNAKGFGFVIGPEQEEVFVHITRVPPDRVIDMVPGAAVTVDAHFMPDGRLQANAVTSIQHPNRAKRCMDAILAAAKNEPVEAIAAGLKQAADICARVGQIDTAHNQSIASERRSSGV